MERHPSRPTARVLVVDDVADVRLLARVALERRGFDVAEAEDGETAVAMVWAGNVDLVLLDVNLPRMSGLAVLTRLRQDSAVPVILVTSLDDESDRVLGLEMGADDYVVKPFAPAELGARAASVLRRCGTAGAVGATGGAAVPDVGPMPARTLELRAEERRVLVSGMSVELTPKEFDLLACLAAAPCRVFSRADLLAQVWGSAPGWQDPATVTEHVRRLRRKIEIDPENPGWIQTARGIGYRFNSTGDAQADQGRAVGA
ncbi:MAG TPA: response regulator transcription factor [Acidimicrobiales bacterium]|nr:response regulator transcription factor [Acidimicrobiales bacterium]